MELESCTQGEELSRKRRRRRRRRRKEEDVERMREK